MSDDFQIEQNISTYVISPDHLLTAAPAAVEDGSYLVRLSNESLGNPSFAVLPLVDGKEADSIRIGEGTVLYVRSAEVDGEVEYRVSGEAQPTSWSEEE